MGERVWFFDTRAPEWSLDLEILIGLAVGLRDDRIF